MFSSKKYYKSFANTDFMNTFASANVLTRNVAQLVAHYVRDVGVGRSSRLIPTENRKLTSPDGGIGRRAGLKHQWSNIHPGSTPGLGTE